MSAKISLDDIKEIDQIKNNNPKSNYIGYCKQIDNIDFKQLLNFLQNSETKFSYWGEPDYNFRFAAFSPILESKSGLKKQFESLDEFYSLFNEKLANNFPDELKHNIPTLVGGLKFFEDEDSDEWSDFKTTDFYLPEFIFIEYFQKSYLIVYEESENFDGTKYQLKVDSLFNSIAESKKAKNGTKISISKIEENQDTLESWSEKINKILSEIEEGNVSKVVLSRSLKFQLAGTPLFASLISELESRYPKCYNFIFRSNDSFFFGASPEQLFKLSKGTVESDALAGSVCIGKTLEEDQMLINNELYNEKNLAEHETVVKYVKKSLEVFTKKIILDIKPKVKKLENIQHLWTPVKAEVLEKSSIISVLKNLHPTPAVCGLPVDSAKKIIKNLEVHKRGLFTGAVGWLNCLGEGEFTVAIRSALLKKNQIHLFAGSGIVRGSEPLSEYNETYLKFKPILKLFNEYNNKS